MNRGASWATLAAAAVLLTTLPAPAEEQGEDLGAELGAELGADLGADLGFVRVNVPTGGLRQVPLDGGRYVPMPLTEFEDSVARLGAAGRSARQPAAVEARYTLALDAAGRLAGTLEFELAAEGAWLPTHMPLGTISAGAGTIRTADGTGEASIFCLPDGACAMRTPGPGRYACTIRLPAAADALLRLPLVPALVTTIALDLPAAVRPIVTGGAATAAAVEPQGDRPGMWRIVRGPVAQGSLLPLVLWDGRRLSAPLAAWNAVAVSGRQAEVVARIEPAAGWTPDRFELTAPPTMLVTGVTAADDGRAIPWTSEGEAVVIAPPDRLVGGRTGIVVTGVAPIATEEPTALPVLQPASGRWGGCGVRLVVDPALAVHRMELDECLAVSAAVGDRWPVPARASLPVAAGLEPALMHLEHQSPAARVRFVVGPREATLDTARLTTVDISPGTVLGRTTADIRVAAGQVFDISADVARGWFIDSVEAIDAPRGRDSEAAAPGRPLDWRLVRSPQGSELRIGLAEAATPRRGVGLRITGHRSGLPLGAEFSSDDIDMVRFPVEQAMLEFQVGPTVVLESPGGPLGLEPLPDRLVPLAGSASPRARIPAGDRAPAVRTRLVRRRPPVQAEVGVELVARDERLAETFTFSCRPVAGELDAVVVHFSEPMGSGLEWSMADPLAGSLSAQPLDPADATRGDLRAEEAVAESWLVELRPATAAGVRFRAVRTVPLEAAAPVPLAWVEAAENPGGTILIRGEAGTRPEIDNRRLCEVPPAAEADAAGIELSYGGPRTIAGGGPAAEVLPPAAGAAARAWAWGQSTVCWCYESGGLEWETTFDLENLGRESVTLALPAGMRVDRVTVADEPVAAAQAGSGANTLAVPLPRRSGRLRIMVRGAGGVDEQPGWWRIGDVACGIDVPVLERDARLMLPPGLVTTAETDRRGPLGRLFGSARDGASDAAAEPATQRGFRAVTLADAGTGGVGVVVIRRPWIWSLAVATGCGSALLAWTLARRSGPAAIAACGVAAVVALWSGTPWDAVARAALWGGIAAVWAAGRQWAGRVPAGMPATVVMAVIGLAGPAAGSALADGSPPLRVFVTPGPDGGTALVPERLFRRLVDTTGGLPSVRVLATETTAAAGAWRIAIDLQADPGGLLVLDQAGTSATWVRVGERSQGLEVSLDAEGRVARVVAAEAGRHRLELDLLPGTTRAGDIESMIARLPPAPRAVLRIDDPGAGGAAGGWQCDRAEPEGLWLPVTGGGQFDLAGAARVRLVRPVDPSLRLATSLAAAVSFNDIIWRGDECRLAASFDVGGEGVIVRSLMLRADHAVEPVAAAGGIVARPVGAGLQLVEIPEPRAGQRRIAVEFRMPLPDPVGVFDAPFAWLEGVETDVRTARLRPEPGIEAAVELPPGMALLRPRAEDGAGTTAVWRCDAVATAESAGGFELRPRITVRRSLPRPRAVQELLVSFADGHVGLRLVYQVEAADAPVVELPVQLPPAAIIEDIVLTRQSAGDAAERSWRRVDLFWSRAAADRIVAVIQRPETGAHRLQLDARLPIRPASRGRLPLARVAADDVPLELRWRAAAGMTVKLEAEPRPGETGERLELQAGQPGPAYRLSRDDALPTPDPATVDVAPSGEPRPAVAAVPRTVIDLAVDASGRAWGLARFDLIARDPEVTVTLPAGLRLFGLRADGREVTTAPLGGNAWRLRLHDVGWPRSLVAVVAGSVGNGVARGEPIRLEPPTISGLPPTAVVWSLRTPAGLAVRVSEPARVLDDEGLAAWSAPAVEQVGQAFNAAIQSASAGQRGRLDAFAAAVRAGAGPGGERDWYEAWRGSSALEPQRVRIAAAEDGTVTFRAVRVASGARAARGLLTAAILAGVLACWLAARRWPTLAGIVSPLFGRWWWAVCGLAWLVFLEPATPGVVMLIAGVWLALPRNALERPSTPPVDGNDSTLTFAAE